MSRPDSTHHHSPLAGVSAGATAVLAATVLILITARRQLGEVATVLTWALVATIVGAVIAAAVYVTLWLRHRILHPETLAGRHVVQAEVLAGDGLSRPRELAAVPQQPAAIEPPREVHLHFHTADPAEAAEIIRTAIPGTAGDAITERN